MIENNSILLVDDDDVLRSRLERAFANRGLRVFTASNYDEAIEAIDQYQPEMAVLDLKMPGKSGMQLLTDIKARAPETKVVLLTGYGSISNAVEAVKLGALNYVTKPADADDVLLAFGSPRPKDEEPEFPPPLVGFCRMGTYPTSPC